MIVIFGLVGKFKRIFTDIEEEVLGLMKRCKRILKKKLKKCGSIVRG
jgi:hypothetical protein